MRHELDEETNFERIGKQQDPEKIIYESSDEQRSCDKNGHRQRSLSNQPNHLKFWKKYDDTEKTKEIKS